MRASKTELTDGIAVAVGAAVGPELDPGADGTAGTVTAAIPDGSDLGSIVPVAPAALLVPCMLIGGGVLGRRSARLWQRLCERVLALCGSNEACGLVSEREPDGPARFRGGASAGGRHEAARRSAPRPTSAANLGSSRF